MRWFGSNSGEPFKFLKTPLCDHVAHLWKTDDLKTFIIFYIMFVVQDTEHIFIMGKTCQINTK